MMSYSEDIVSLTSQANLVKEIVINRLFLDGLLKDISRDKLDALIAKYVVIVAEQGMLGKIWQKLEGTKDKSLTYIITKTS